MTTTTGARRRFSTRQKASATRHAIETAWPRSLRFLTSTLANEAFRLHGDRVAMLAAGAGRDEPQVERVVLRIQASQDPQHATAADFDLRGTQGRVRQPLKCAVFGCHEWEIHCCHQHQHVAERLCRSGSTRQMTRYGQGSATRTLGTSPTVSER